MSFCFSVLKTQSIMYFLHSVSVSGFNSLTRHGLSNKQCCNKAWKPMIYKVLHVSNCAGRSHLICWPWLSYVKFAQCAGVEKKSRAASLRVTFSHHYAVLFRVPTWGLVLVPLQYRVITIPAEKPHLKQNSSIPLRTSNFRSFPTD